MATTPSAHSLTSHGMTHVKAHVNPLVAIGDPLFLGGGLLAAYKSVLYTWRKMKAAYIFFFLCLLFSSEQLRRTVVTRHNTSSAGLRLDTVRVSRCQIYGMILS